MITSLRSGVAFAILRRPRITDPAEVEQFADAAFRPGSLVSNGFRSFRNWADEAYNREVREVFLVCLGCRR